MESYRFNRFKSILAERAIKRKLLPTKEPKNFFKNFLKNPKERAEINTNLKEIPLLRIERKRALLGKPKRTFIKYIKNFV